MGKHSKIEWCDHTFNPFIGCTKVSPGCDHCYAEHLMDTRMHKVVWGVHGERVRTSAANWKKPLVWNAQPFVECSHCGRRGELRDWLRQVPTRAGMTYRTRCPGCSGFDCDLPARPRVFCASLGDVFDNAVDPAWRVDLFRLIARTPNLDWLLLTKRIGNARAMLNQVVEEMSCGLNTWDELPWPGVWLGATIISQAEADRDVPKLLEVPSRMRFLSMEPLLGPISFEGMYARADWRDCTNAIEDLDWVIVGGESGPDARPMHPDWARSLRDQCAATSVPFFFKQWGEWRAAPEIADASGPMFHQFGDGTWMQRVGKKAAGRAIDGQVHDGFPKVTMEVPYVRC